ncbi:purple acid phosphatase family protein [Streptomyces sp. DSM 40750]|uniref:purple acid phosphatase family protein n=1 Tax=Streptomyces sp. DSM 40750 TaxID=2801030 RepID=UPI00214AD0B0|nr:metallophosphoesterase family protein [Streptomyces sp. DSM 40750]UUU25117.1 metallophosphoesterase family protein [Streptomyces sp. DSM 40750]
MDTPNLGIPEQLARRLSMPEQHEYLRTKLSRRGTLATAGAVASGLLVGGCSGSEDEPARKRSSPPAPATATGRVHGSVVVPFGRRLAFGADPKTQMRISWQVPFAVKKPYVRVGLKPWELSRKIEAEVRDLRTPSLSKRLPAVEQYYVHAALDGLKPGTTYYYGVGHEGFDPADRLETLGTFTTAPAKAESFVFTAFGDQGVSYDALANDQVILGQNPAFHLHAGDICYADTTGHGEKDDVYDARVWDQFLAQTESVAKSVPWMVSYGNHDMEAWYSPDGYGGQLARWSLPDNGFDPRKAPGVYSFVYGNVGVLSLDANDVSYEIPANLGYTDGKQTKWLDRRLGELRASDAVDFIVVFFHHCVYSTSTHASDGGLRDAWLPLFTEHQVDLVINGHNHVYERTDAIKGGEVGKRVPVGASTDPTRDGTVYVTAGGAGKELYGFPDGVADSYEGHLEESPDRESVESYHWTEEREKKSETVEWSRVRYTGFSFLSVEVEAGATPRLTVSALAQTGARIDHFEVRRGA